MFKPAGESGSHGVELGQHIQETDPSPGEKYHAAPGKDPSDRDDETSAHRRKLIDANASGESFLFPSVAAIIRAMVIARRGKCTKQNAGGSLDDWLCRPTALPPLPEPARIAEKCLSSLTLPSAQLPIQELIKRALKEIKYGCRTIGVHLTGRYGVCWRPERLRK
jgi:hypothetical protein